MGQVITALQQKGGAGKSTLLCCLSGFLAYDDARVVIVDTDPQRSCVQWAEEAEIPGLDVLEHRAERTLLEVISKLKKAYDVVLVDTAGYDSAIACYAIQASDLILIPSRGSKRDVVGAATTWKHVQTQVKGRKTPPQIRIAMWNVKPATLVYRHGREALEKAGLPLLQGTVNALTGFENMSWNGGLPDGEALRAFGEFIAALQLEALLDYYAGAQEVA